MRPCIFRMKFRMHEIICIFIRRVLYPPVEPARKVAESPETGRDGEVLHRLTTAQPVEKAVESVHNFLYIPVLFSRRA